MIISMKHSTNYRILCNSTFTFCLNSIQAIWRHYNITLSTSSNDITTINLYLLGVYIQMLFRFLLEWFWWTKLSQILALFDSAVTFLFSKYQVRLLVTNNKIFFYITAMSFCNKNIFNIMNFTPGDANCAGLQTLWAIKYFSERICNGNSRDEHWKFSLFFNLWGQSKI